jgi:glyoxylase-like metal-dependent hydrolase (beta-lactamase superfamily II)
MVGIVFRRIKISIHAPRRAEFEQPAPVRHRPERPKEAFDDTAARKGFVRAHAESMLHGIVGGARLRVFFRANSIRAQEGKGTSVHVKQLQRQIIAIDFFSPRQEMSIDPRQRCLMNDVQQLSRRQWLARLAAGSFAVISELQFGLGRKGWGIALGDAQLAAGVAHAQALGPTKALQVAMGFVNGYVLVRGKEVAVVDTGTPNNASKIAGVVRSAGLDWNAVQHVILTHYHPDHIGSVGEVLVAAPKATAYAGTADLAQIQSPRPIKAVNDNDEVFGLRIIATPGHTPGHVCVFDPVGSLIVLGDAMNNMDNKLSGPNPQYSADMAVAHQSVKKLAKLNFQRAFFGHGEPIEKGASQAIAKLAGTL